MRETCLKTVYELAKQDERVVFIGSDLGPDTAARVRKRLSEANMSATWRNSASAWSSPRKSKACATSH